MNRSLAGQCSLPGQLITLDSSCLVFLDLVGSFFARTDGLPFVVGRSDSKHFEQFESI